MSHTLFATCEAGLEALLAEDVRALGAEEVRPAARGVAFHGGREVLWRVNLQSRLANRVLLTLAEVEAHSRDALYAGVFRIDWPKLFSSDRTIAVDASSFDSSQSNTAFMSQVVKDAICDRFRHATPHRPSVDKLAPDVPINARVFKDRCTLSLDTSGARLHRRGYRTEAGEAPLKETLAAGLLALAGWRGDTPLLDPMCGSGTLVIEAALLARGLAPGLARLGGEGFALQRLANHDAAAFAALAQSLRAAARPTAGVPIVGVDRDPAVIELARRNARRAGVEADIELRVGDVRDVQPIAAAGTIVTNPPYGVRLGDPASLAPLYEELGSLFKHRFGGHVAWVLAGDRELAANIGLRPSKRIPLHNGPIDCRLLRFELYSGTRRVS